MTALEELREWLNNRWTLCDAAVKAEPCGLHYGYKRQIEATLSKLNELQEKSEEKQP